jgi:hypothetical protein
MKRLRTSIGNRCVFAAQRLVAFLLRVRLDF